MQSSMGKALSMEVDLVVARWEAGEKAVRARLKDPDAAPQEQIAGRSGMEVFEAMPDDTGTAVVPAQS